MAEEKEPQAVPSSVGGQAGAADEWFDLLPVEKKLISASLVLGLGLLVVFIFVFEVYK